MATTATTAQTGYGFKFGVGPASTSAGPQVGATYVEVKYLKTCSWSGSKNDTDDVTNTDSPNGIKEFIPTLTDPGEYKISGHRNSADPGLIALKAAYIAKVNYDFQLIYPMATGQTTGGDKEVFSGLVTDFSIDLTIDKAITFTATVKISGAATDTAGS